MNKDQATSAAIAAKVGESVMLVTRDATLKFRVEHLCKIVDGELVMVDPTNPKNTITAPKNGYYELVKWTA